MLDICTSATFHYEARIKWQTIFDGWMLPCFVNITACSFISKLSCLYHWHPKANCVKLQPCMRPYSDSQPEWERDEAVDANSTGAMGKMPWYPRQKRGKSIILQRYSLPRLQFQHFCHTQKWWKFLLSDAFSQLKIDKNAFAGPGSHWESLPRLHQLRMETPLPFLTPPASQFPAYLVPRLSAPRHAAPVLIIKVGPYVWGRFVYIYCVMLSVCKFIILHVMC